MPPEVVLVRHGETEWTITGQHTGFTDIPLTERGRDQARRLQHSLAGRHFSRVLSSPLIRALETCRLAGLDDAVETTDDLLEWDYGDYEGRTTVEIRKKRRQWSLWLDGAPGGESAASVGTRVDRIIEEIRDGASPGGRGAAVVPEPRGAGTGDVALFAHGHVLRVLAARWLGLPPGEGRLFALHPATVSVLGYERETPVIVHWNVRSLGEADG